MYTIANDLCEFKEFEHGETIINQDCKSKLNLYYLFQEKKTIKNLKQKDKDFILSQKLTQKCNYQTLKQQWDDRQKVNDWYSIVAKKKRDEELA